MMGQQPEVSTQSVRRYQGLDLLKAICCIAILFRHCRFPGIVGSIPGALLTFPIPVFFMISGYFSYGKPDAWIKKKAFYILKVLLISELVYGVLEIVLACLDGGTVAGVLSDLIGNQSIPVFILKSVFFGAMFWGPGWYLYAIFWSWWLLLLVRRFPWKYALIPVLLVISLVGRTWCAARAEDIEAVIFLFRSAPLFGLPFVLLGSAIKERSLKNDPVFTRTQLIWMLAAGAVLMAVEYVLTRTTADFRVSTVLISIAVFYIALCLPVLPEKLAPLCYIGRAMSLWVYVSHVAFRSLVDFAAAHLNLSKHPAFLWTRPLIICALTLLFSYGMSVLQQRRRSRQRA